MSIRRHVVSVLCIFCTAALAPQPTPIVWTVDGPLFGAMSSLGTYSFRGVPFAAPPVGDLRFAPPAPVVPWKKQRNATVFGPGCMAHCNGKFASLMCPATVSEDCLFLNVYTPTLNDSARLPVILFIHGGTFEWGSGGIPLYDGAEWAKNESVVIVTINYRLNVFGGLFTTAGPKGNFMLLDQQAAMKWVATNIKFFGGDPRTVAISGQSAGATSVGVHLVVPSSWPYFQRAIVMSDPYGLNPLDVTLASSLGEVILLKLGCPSNDTASQLDCLRRKSTAEIFATADTNFIPFPKNVLIDLMQWGPVVDGTIVPHQPLDAMRTGDFHRVPLYIGTVANETVVFVYGVSFNLSTVLLDVALEYIFGREHGAQIVGLYGPMPPAGVDTRPMLSRILTDYLFYCPTRYAAKQASLRARTYVYFFDEHPSWAAWYTGGPDKPCAKYICHAFDLPSVFNTYRKLPRGFPSPTAGEVAMGAYVQQAWANVTRDVPLEDWPPFSPSGLEAKNISIPIKSTAILRGYRARYCDYFDKIGYRRW